MQGITLGIALVVCASFFLLRPHQAALVFLAVVLWYPYFLVIQLGTLDISATRIIIVPLMIKCLADSRIRQSFQWCWLDTCLVICMFVFSVVFFINNPTRQGLENRSGFFLNTIFVYFTVRLCLRDRSELITVAKWMGIILLPLAFLGMFEAITDVRYFYALRKYCPWFTHEPNLPPRWGFTRAVGPFAHPVTFGMSFCMFLPLVYWLRHQKGAWRQFAYPLSGLLVLGAVSSFSSGPAVMLIVVFICLALELMKGMVKPFLIFVVFSIIFISIASNRTFYHVIASYGNLLGGAGYHRAKLIDNAIADIGDWWLKGYGGKDPGWGPSLGMSFTDMTNEFILDIYFYGLWGLIAFCVVLACALLMLIQIYKNNPGPLWRSYVWALSSALISLIITFNSIGMLGEMTILFYYFLGLIGSSYVCLSKNRVLQPSRSPHPKRV